MAGREPERACPGCCTQYRAGACLERRGLPAHLPARCQGLDYAPETDSDLNDLVRLTCLSVCLCVFVLLVSAEHSQQADKHAQTQTLSEDQPDDKPEWPNKVREVAQA